MNRIKLRNGGKCRRKALLGADGAVMAAATLAAAGITTAATIAGAKQQAKAAEEAAKTQADSIKAQTANNNALQKEQLDFSRSQNMENRQQQQDIQTTLQMLAGQTNMNDRMEANKQQLRYGGKPKRQSMKQPLYGGERFQVTDGGGVIPLATSPEGFGLYELYGNDHEHYHKTRGGKAKTGVGIKFNDGSVVEGEGNQNTNQGELLYVTPTDAMFLSKHSIDGFNPTKAVLNGVDPEEAFAMQETLKFYNGMNDDGSKKKRNSMKKLLGGNYNVALDNTSANQLLTGTNAGAAGGAAFILNSQNPPAVDSPTYTRALAKNGGRIRLKCGGKPRRKAAWGDWAGSVYGAAGNLLGAGISVLGNMYASNQLAKGYNKAGQYISDAYSQMHGIDMSELKREDYMAPHAMAVIRDANTNINPQLERIRRNAAYETREINRGTMSSAARQQRLAATNERMNQHMSEIYANKANTDESIKQGNADRITKVASENATRDAQALQQYSAQRMSLLQYNNSIENAKLAGIGQAKADALTQSSLARAQGLQSSLNAVGSALNASGQGFAQAADAVRKNEIEDAYRFAGLPDNQKADYAIMSKNPRLAKQEYTKVQNQIAEIQSRIDALNTTDGSAISPENRTKIDGLMSDLEALRKKGNQLYAIYA